MINPELPGGNRWIDVLAGISAIDGVADALAAPVRSWRDANPALKNALSGTWLGHSLHPVLTDVPIGAFATLAVLDLADVAGLAPVADAADIVLGFGILGALAASAAGLSDWSDTAAAPKRIGWWHALCNGVAVGAYCTSFVLRRRGRRRRGIVASVVGLAALKLGGYLGGELSTGMQLGVKHTGEPMMPPEDYVDVAAEDDCVEGKPLRCDAGGINVVVVRQGASIVALANACTHRGAPLHEGTVENGCIVCPWHASRFDLLTGCVREGPATFAQPVFDVRVSGGRVSIRRLSG